MDETTLGFVAEIKQVKSRKTASQDIEYQILLNTEDSQVLELGKLPADTLVTVEVKVEHG